MKPSISFLIKNKALRYPLFRNFLALRLAMILALNLQSAIIGYFVYELTKEKLALGMLGLSEVIPAIIFSLFSGHFVDLREKKGLLMQCIIGYILLTGFYIILALPQMQHWTTIDTIKWLFYAGAFIGGILRAFLSPTTFALLANLVPRKLYANATTWSSAAWQMGFVIGPLLSGFFIAWCGYPVSFAIVLGIEIISLLALVKIPQQPILVKEKEPITQSLKQGLRFVFSTQLILAALSLDMFAVLFGGAVALLPVYAIDILHVGEVGYGWMRAAPGIGSIITLFILSLIPLKSNPGIKLLVCIAGFGATTIIFGLCGSIGGNNILASLWGFNITSGFLLAFAMLLLGGMFDAVSVVIRGTILQVKTPDNMRGRVAAVNTMFISSSNELGAMESGITAKWMGTVPAVVFGGCMTMIVVGVTYFATPMLRKLQLTDDKREP